MFFLLDFLSLNSAKVISLKILLNKTITTTIVATAKPNAIIRGPKIIPNMIPPTTFHIFIIVKSL